MQTNPKNKENPVSAGISTVNIIILGIISFLGVYFALPERGLISSFPVILITALACALVKSSAVSKAVILGVFALTLSSITRYGEYSYIFTLLCVATSLLCSAAFKLFLKRKAVYSAISISLLIACAAANFMFFGDIISASKADNIISDYTALRYEDDSVKISGTYYDYKSGRYKAEVYDQSLPTAKFYISVMGGKAYDSFTLLAEETLLYNGMREIIDFLNEEFPKDSFEVRAVEITGYPVNKISLKDQADYSALSAYRVIIKGVSSEEEFFERAEAYFNALNGSDIKFKKIYFNITSGYGGTYSAYGVKSPLFGGVKKLFGSPYISS